MIGTNQVLYFGVAAHRTGDAHKGGYLAAYLFEWIDYTTQQQITHQRQITGQFRGKQPPPPRPYLMFAIFSDRHFWQFLENVFRKRDRDLRAGVKNRVFPGLWLSDSKTVKTKDGRGNSVRPLFAICNRVFLITVQ